MNAFDVGLVDGLEKVATEKRYSSIELEKKPLLFGRTKKIDLMHHDPIAFSGAMNDYMKRGYKPVKGSGFKDKSFDEVKEYMRSSYATKK